MRAEMIVDAMGGRKQVMKITGLSKGRISQWVTENHIPPSWLVAFEAMRPDVDWAYLRGTSRAEEAGVNMRQA